MDNIWQKITGSSSAKTILSIVLTVGILVLLLSQISMTDLVKLFSDLSYRWIAVGVLFYLITNVGRAFRLQLLLPNQVTYFHKLLPIVVAQSMFNNILPARTGEFSLLYFLKKYEAVPLDGGGVALIVARVVDYLAVAVIFIFAALVSLGDILEDVSLTTNIIKAVLAVMVVTVMLLISTVWWGQKILALIELLIDRFGLTPSQSIAFVLKTLRRIIAALIALHSWRRYVLVSLWSLGLWFTTFAWFYAFLRAIGVNTTFLSTIVGSTFAVISKAIPFISVGGIGPHEAGWTVGFILVGFDKTTAISSGFAVNILTLLTSIILGVGSLWVLRHYQNRSDNAVYQRRTGDAL